MEQRLREVTKSSYRSKYTEHEFNIHSDDARDAGSLPNFLIRTKAYIYPLDKNRSSENEAETVNQLKFHKNCQRYFNSDDQTPTKKAIPSTPIKKRVIDLASSSDEEATVTVTMGSVALPILQGVTITEGALPPSLVTRNASAMRGAPDVIRESPKKMRWEGLLRHTYIDLPPFCEVRREEWDSRRWNSANLLLRSLRSLTSLNDQEWDSDSGASNNSYLNSAAARVRETMGEKFCVAARPRAMSPTLGQLWRQKNADEI
ncbi:hypothetical protein C8R44DRAFT_747671 [Mycena epipterygia]|nr:hypothetical protein C8R44DRAFT_747671 [Mycena epipterygia]